MLAKACGVAREWRVGTREIEIVSDAYERAEENETIVKE
jgi:hypothetical protein